MRQQYLWYACSERLTFAGVIAFLSSMVMLRMKGSIHKAVPLGQGARARIEAARTAGGLSEFQEKFKGVARAATERMNRPVSSNQNLKPLE